VIKLGDVVMMFDLHRQGLLISVIARELGSETVRRTIVRRRSLCCMGRAPPPRLIDPFVPYLRGPRPTRGLTGQQLWREHGYAGGYTAVTDLLREL
jgi:hypothetical protein